MEQQHTKQLRFGPMLCEPCIRPHIELHALLAYGVGAWLMLLRSHRTRLVQSGALQSCAAFQKPVITRAKCIFKIKKDIYID